MALSSDWELCWPKLCSPSPHACGQAKVLMGVSCFLSREFPFSWLFQSMLERKQDMPLSHQPGDRAPQEAQQLGEARLGQPHQSHLSPLVACRFICFGAFLYKISSSSEYLIQQFNVWSIIFRLHTRCFLKPLDPQHLPPVVGMLPTLIHVCAMNGWK